MGDDAWSTRRSLDLENAIVGLVADCSRPRRFGKALRSQSTLHLSGGDIVRVLWDDGIESTHRAELLSIASAAELRRRQRDLAFGPEEDGSAPQRSMPHVERASAAGGRGTERPSDPMPLVQLKPHR